MIPSVKGGLLRCVCVCVSVSGECVYVFVSECVCVSMSVCGVCMCLSDCVCVFGGGRITPDRSTPPNTDPLT